VAARPRIPPLPAIVAWCGQGAARAVAAIDESPINQRARGLAVDVVPIALGAFSGAGPKTRDRIVVCVEPQPLEIVQDAALVLRAASLAVVVLDPQHDA